LALYMASSLYPEFDKSTKWLNKGKQILLHKKCLGQFYEDGGYCQLSFNYQRLAIHYLLWLYKFAKFNKDQEVIHAITPILERSFYFLISFMNDSDGQLPNWGANDGALLNPWTTCDFSDFRPLLQTLSYITRGKRIFPDGPWDKELSSFLDLEVKNIPIEKLKLRSCSYPGTGIHVLRKTADDFVLFRCGSVRDRFGQADQLHVDVWWKGLNIAVDGGSYLYNAEPQYHRYFMGTRSHSTVTVDDMDQMLLYRRFKWLNWTKARLLRFTDCLVEGEHYGYFHTKGKVTHRRSVEWQGDKIIICDVLEPQKKCETKYELHWALNDYPFEVEEINETVKKIILSTPKGPVHFTVECSEHADISVRRAYDDENKPDGWQSRHYGQKTPAVSVRLVCKSDSGCKYKCTFL
jgi:hypothetical protein